MYISSLFDVFFDILCLSSLMLKVYFSDGPTDKIVVFQEFTQSPQATYDGIMSIIIKLDTYKPKIYCLGFLILSHLRDATIQTLTPRIAPSRSGKR